MVLWKSIDEPSVPKKKGVVRANMGVSGTYSRIFS